MHTLIPDRVENIVEKGENSGYQNFSPFPTMFSNCFPTSLLKPVTFDKGLI